jgi:hypothetical protein
VRKGNEISTFFVAAIEGVLMMFPMTQQMSFENCERTSKFETFAPVFDVLYPLISTYLTDVSSFLDVQQMVEHCRCTFMLI